VSSRGLPPEAYSSALLRGEPGDDSLVQCLIKVRNALGSSSQIIKTVPRRGYIFDTAVSDSSTGQMTKYTEETSGVQVIIEEEESDGRRRVGSAALPDAGRLALLPGKSIVIRRVTTAFHSYRISKL
jgi:hypothetical protein